MKRITLSVAATVAGLMIGPNLASALTAKTAESTKLRAGPAFDFPVVDRIPDDVKVRVHGCVRAYRWCDISWRDARGWVPGDELAYLYHERYVPVVEYGPRIGLPIVVFSFDAYWDNHYRGRPWYGERTRWRTVWRDHGGGERKKDADRSSNRREGQPEADHRQGDVDRHQSDSRRDATRDNRDQGKSSERTTSRPANRDERSRGRAERGESREGSGSRALSPGDNHGPSSRESPRVDVTMKAENNRVVDPTNLSYRRGLPPSEALVACPFIDVVAMVAYAVRGGRSGRAGMLSGSIAANQFLNASRSTLE